MTLPTLPARGGALSGLVKGLSSGVQQALPAIQDLISKKMQQKNLMESLGMGKQAQPSQDQQDALFHQLAANTEKSLGREISPEETTQLWNSLQAQQNQQQPEMDNNQKALISALQGQDALSKHFSNLAQTESKQQFQMKQSGEPKLQELEDKLNTYQQQGMRFGRLNNLFSPELESKFPPTWQVGLLTKDGELTPLAQSQLSPEAQESIKLITDEIRGAKDTFGARVTNFDASTYLKTLPSLLNTAEGRRRVLRDLQIMNELNTNQTQGVLDIIDQNGGPGKMSVSQAERLYKKRNIGKISELQNEFINPNKTQFNSLPSPSRFKGQSITDEDTGQSFVSDGNEWIPENK